MVISGAAQPQITRQSLYPFKIPVPPLEVQREIVTVIEGYQKLIDGARQVVENWKPQIDIQPEWPMVKLGDIGELKYGFTASAEDDGSARFIRITDITEEGLLQQKDPKYINISEENIEYLLQKDDLLVARTGATYGKTMLFNENIKAIYASYLIRIRFPKKDVLPDYYWAFAQSEKYWIQARSLVSGGGQPQFNGNVLKEMSIPLPPLDVQHEIVDKIKAERKSVDGCRELIAIYEAKIKQVINKIWEE
jgi:restriction endonuclease S subunit